MNQQAFEAGQQAYQQGNYLEAITQFNLAKNPGEVAGAADHLLGNCYMKLGRYDEAAKSYSAALADGSYAQHKGALACNRGRALLAARHPQEAIAPLTMAAQDETYPTPYKAHVALGRAYLALGNVREAGIAFRNAAIDEANPDPSSALRSLGACFMQMGRAVDAVEAYRTALDFSGPLVNQNAIYADLGLAYVAANRMNEAQDAFVHATSDGTYTLTPEAQAAYDAARKAVAAISGGKPSETDAFLAAAGYKSAVDPLDPTGASGQFMPSPEDTGFFSVSEEDLVAQDMHERKKARKSSHRGLKVLIIILIILLLAGAACGFAYYRGYGWPTQEQVVTSLFESQATNASPEQYLDGAISSESRQKILSLLPVTSSSLTIDGVDRAMNTSTVVATATLANGGTQTYQIGLVRSGLGWKVNSVSASYASTNSQPTTLQSDGTNTTGSSADTASATNTNTDTTSATSTSATSTSTDTTTNAGSTQGSVNQTSTNQ